MADLCVLSSVGEGFPTSLLDAMALGVPTVATWVGGVPEMYGSINAPELVPPQDPEALARNLLWVLEDPRESEGRVARGKQTAGRFTVAAMAEQYERVYSDLLHEQP
jgi:glycosyltransferase involved in cell wall biosynthesis